ncbi:AlbA family DNA-binding domain-containing protein [Clostridium tagluense]|uniref:Schlafen AlbA-2 domain-containing protein n=1 Tax=Clostridium tagluense TaxID=360422 RepID=A0A401UU18_9CLOT|nr:RNA-binding domain-containing protein [Clostridium tagluense]GCD13004.1 hypothetical protein Ctaglu_46270 [Clostridium tagluense]
MEYKKFKELLNKGECKNIDYKIQCNAFMRGKDEAKVELVKDIIAFSNNGNTASYLIIGVADSRNGFKSVENDRLTDDNIQNLCKDYIFPIPKVKLINCCWNKVTDERHKDKKFIIIQVGPQARQCFRFNRDCIEYEKKYCFKKNEVWIRREATSDLALPEEIKRLVEGKEPIAEIDVENNIKYDRLSRYEIINVIRQDLLDFVGNINGVLRNKAIPIFKYPEEEGNLLSLNINGMNLKIIVIIKEKFNEQGIISKVCRLKLPFHHGLLLISIGNITNSALGGCPIKIKENWGIFAIKNATAVKDRIRDLPTTDKKLNWNLLEPFCLSLDKVNSTQILQNKLQGMVNTIIEKEDIGNYIKNIYQRINVCLIKWRENECVVATDKVFYDETDKTNYYNKEVVRNLAEGEFIDKERFGNIVMTKELKMCKVVDEFIEKNDLTNMPINENCP